MVQPGQSKMSHPLTSFLSRAAKKKCVESAIMLNDIGSLWLARSTPSIVVNKNITKNT
jgi:hypothetical protein